MLRLLVLLALPIVALAEAPLKIGRGERLLVFAPHPDDEVLGTGGLIQEVLAQGGSARVVIATAGDGYVEAVREYTGSINPKFADYLRYGAERLAEARRAVQALGNGRIRLDLLGFPDGGLLPLLHAHWSQPERSLTTGVGAVPYAQAEFPGHIYDGAELLAELLHLLRDTRPTLVALPDTLDAHPDHAALGQFALLALHDWLRAHGEPPPNEAARRPRILAYLVHWSVGWPAGAAASTPLDLSATPLSLPDDLPQRGQQRACLVLNPREKKLKRVALAQHQTQQRAMAPFLSAFVRATECVSLLSSMDDYAAEARQARERRIPK